MSLREKIAARKPRIHSTLTLDIDGPEALDIIAPTQGQRLELFDAATKAGEIDEKGESTSPLSGMLFAARLIVALVYQDGKPVFAGPDAVRQVMDLDVFEDLAEPVASALRGKSVEETQGE